MRRIDYTGRKKGRLIALKPDPVIGRNWICLCECGTYKSLAFSSTSAKSCGCLHTPVDELYHIELRKRVKERTNIDQNGCWNWSLQIEPAGYGKSTYRQKQIRAHVLSWIAYKGNVPEGFCVCHTCDNRKCVNPDHLFLGTHKQNTRDMVDKDRHTRGSRNACSKLHEDDIIEIKRLYNSGQMTQREIAMLYGKRPQKINCIMRGRSWKHVDVKPLDMQEKAE